MSTNAMGQKLRSAKCDGVKTAICDVAEYEELSQSVFGVVSVNKNQMKNEIL